MTAPVVVGIDDMEHSAHAVAAAAHEAQLRGAPLWLGHSYQWVPPVASGFMPGGDTPEGFVRDAATSLLAEAVKQVHLDHPDLDVHSYAMSGPAAANLGDLAKDAALLVVGARGRGGFPGLAVGSVALRSVAHARCPVLITRGASDGGTNRVMVGLDLAEPVSGPALLEFAFNEATLRGADISAIHAWEDPAYFYPVAIGQFSREQLDAMNGDRRQRLQSLTAPWQSKYPDVVVDAHVFTGSPARRLVDASRLADLLVIGGRRHHGGVGMRLGGLAHTLLRHAHCPVVIVPES